MSSIAADLSSSFSSAALPPISLASPPLLPSKSPSIRRQYASQTVSISTTGQYSPTSNARLNNPTALDHASSELTWSRSCRALFLVGSIFRSANPAIASGYVYTWHRCRFLYVVSPTAGFSPIHGQRVVLLASWPGRWIWIGRKVSFEPGSKMEDVLVQAGPSASWNSSAWLSRVHWSVEVRG